MAGTADPTESADTGTLWLQGIMWGTQWDSGAAPGEATVVTYYVAGQNGPERVESDGGDVKALVPQAEELAAIQAAMASYEAVCNLVFVEATSQDDADVVWVMSDSKGAEGALGWANPPGTETNGADGAQSLVVINQEAYDPQPGTAGALVPGGFDIITFTHELGHALGLAHPHDKGGSSIKFPGVSGSGDTGDFGMNQGVFTTMTYVDGWVDGPGGPSTDPSFGWEFGPMALDIAAVQAMYGANAATATGDDAYQLPSADGVGTFYSSIWDAGGRDTMRGTAGADVIDLRAATLEVAPGGGGFVSHAGAVEGGFTIAHGVTIEDAAGGAGNDVLTGNDARNGLRGEVGNDVLKGGAGGDELRGGDGADVLRGSLGADLIFGDAGTDQLRGGSDADTIQGGHGADRIRGGGGADRFVFVAATDSGPDAADTILDFGTGADRLDLSAIDALAGTPGDDAFALDRNGDFAAGEIRQTTGKGGLLIEINLDSDAAAEMAIRLAAVKDPLAASAFDL